MIKPALLTLFSAVLAGCMAAPTLTMPTDSWFDGFTVTAREEMTLTVLPRLGTCSAWGVESTPCIQVRNEKGEEFGLINGIVGFDYTPGQHRRVVVEFRAYGDNAATGLILPTDLNATEYIYLRDAE